MPPPADVEAAAVRCLVKCCSKELEQVLLHPQPEEHLPVPLSGLKLAEADVQLADALLKTPKIMLALMEDALVGAQHAVMRHHPAKQQMSVKENAHVRLHSLPPAMDPCCRRFHPSITALGSRHIDQLVQVSGTVVRSGSVKMFEAQKLFECNKCKERFVLRCSVEDGGAVTMPTECPRTDRQCPGTNFKPVPGVQLFTSYQEIKVQERSSGVDPGTLPGALTVVLQDELADSVQAGDDVHITGVVVARWRPMFPGARCEAELCLIASHMTVASHKHKSTVEVPQQMVDMFTDFWAAHRGCPLVGRNKIIAGICPQICGMFVTKLATVLTLIGGVTRVDGSGAHIRGEVHMLLIGDPGTGKSQIMKFAARVSPRSVVTTGKGSSGAGLTVTAVKDGGQWTLEAGALVLADGGLCCIDEFDGIREADRYAAEQHGLQEQGPAVEAFGHRGMIHEAMEQQTVHVAKAGMVTTLSTRTSVIGATNPRGHLDPLQQLGGFSSLSSPLLSRFDIVLLLRDSRHTAWDTLVASQVLANHQDHGGAGDVSEQRDQGSGGGGGGGGGDGAGAAGAVGGWTIGVLQQYVVWAKRSFLPVLTSEAEAVLVAFYQSMRQAQDRSAARTTIRMLESLVRVAQAHARLMARHEVLLQDAVVAVAVMDCSAGPASLLGLSATSSSFNEEPDQEYAKYERVVLRALGLLPPGLLLEGGAGGSQA